MQDTETGDMTNQIPSSDTEKSALGGDTGIVGDATPSDNTKDTQLREQLLILRDNQIYHVILMTSSLNLQRILNQVSCMLHDRKHNWILLSK